MKQLSIQEKAKAYDEIIERLKNFQFEYRFSPFSDVISDKFPELKDSEDERIRKDIITYLVQSANSATLKVNAQKFNKWITWLEKQGKQKPADFSDLRTWKYIVDAVLTEKEGIGQYLDSPFTEEVAKKLQKRFGNIEQKYDVSDNDSEKRFVQGDDKDKELSLSLQIQAYLNTASDELYASGKPLCSEKHIKDIHKCMLMWKKLHDSYFNRIYTWSEEDEQYLLVCKNALAKYQTTDKWDACIISHWLENKLKSFRPQNTWKPSGAQLGIIAQSVAMLKVFGYGELGDRLGDISEQLHKLSEE